MDKSQETRNQIERMPFWAHMSERERTRLMEFAVIREYEAGSMLHATDGDCLGMVVVLQGSVRAYMVSEEGREITLYHINKGETDVLTASCILYQITFDTEMVVEEDSRILILPTVVLKGLKEENVYVRSYIYEVLTERFSDVMWTMQQILFYGIDQRIAAFLLDQVAGNGIRSGQVPEIHITHEQIAREINTAREVVARIIRRFVADGLVETGRGRLRLIDLKGLRALTEGMG